MSRASLVASCGVVAGALALYLSGESLGISAAAAGAAALLLLTLGLFALGAVPESYTALLFFTLGTVLGIAPPQVLFAGFATSAFWLVFAGLLLGEAMKSTGLAHRWSHALLGPGSRSYGPLIGRVIGISALACFVMPSTPARILLLLPVMSAMAERAGLPAGSRGHTGVALACILGSYFVGATLLTANAPNLVLAGAAESLHQVQLGYTGYAIALFPVLGMGKALVLWALITWLFRQPLQPHGLATATQAPLDRAQRRLALILALTLLAWLTDGWHQVQPGWIALAAASACLAPRLGVLQPGALGKPMSVGPLLYLAAALGLGTLIAHSGLIDLVSGPVVSGLALTDGTAGYWRYLKIALFTTLVGLLTTNPGLPALTAPLAPAFVAGSGWPLETGLLLTAVGYATLIAPYQAPPIVIGLHTAAIRVRTVGAAMALAALLTVALLWPLNYLWWRMLGLLS